MTTHMSGPLNVSGGVVADVTSTGTSSVSTLNFGAGGKVKVDSGTGTSSAGAVTISKMCGVVTTESLNTAGGANKVITLTNTTIVSTDIICVNPMGGTNTTKNYTIEAVPGTGSATITIYNNTAATAFNGTIIFGFEVLHTA